MFGSVWTIIKGFPRPGPNVPYMGIGYKQFCVFVWHVSGLCLFAPGTPVYNFQFMFGEQLQQGQTYIGIGTLSVKFT